MAVATIHTTLARPADLRGGRCAVTVCAMGLRVIGAGVGRTGTLSLKGALETLLGGPCYHMMEVITHPAHVDVWRAAGSGEDVDWAAFLAGYAATSDFPACLFWRDLRELYPDALVLLSTRSSTQTWWESASQTI